MSSSKKKMKSELTIGKVLKPRGLKGEVKIEIYSSDSARFSRLKKMKIDGAEYDVEHISTEGGIGYVTLNGVDSVEKAELLRGKFITANRDDLPKLPDGKYYIVDMIGLDVVVGGEVVGVVENVLQYGSCDVYVVKNGKDSLSFPAVPSLLKEVDFQNGKMVLDDILFPRVVVYN